MKQYITILFLIMSITLMSQSKVNWMSMQEAIAQSEKDGAKAKKVFIDAYTDWCGWCKRMDNTTFSDSIVANFLNQNYYPVKFDAETNDTIVFRGQGYTNSKPGEPKSRGRGNAHWLAVALLDGQLSYPSYIILDEKMNRIAVYKGYMEAYNVMSALTFFSSDMYQQYANFLYQEFAKSLNQGK